MHASLVLYWTAMLALPRIAAIGRIIKVDDIKKCGAMLSGNYNSCDTAAVTFLQRLKLHKPPIDAQT